MASSRLDLDAESRRALEFDLVLDLVAESAATAPGASLVRGLEPSADREWIRHQQTTVEEAVRLLDDEGRFVPAGLPDPVGVMDHLVVEGWHPEAGSLRDLATVLLAAADLRKHLGGLDEDDFGSLREAGAGLPDLRAEASYVARNVTPEGRVEDSASPELRRLRLAMARLGERLRRMLERMVRGPTADRSIRDDFVTQRNGRFVVPVRSDAPQPPRGIVHASSSSGATLFVEPLETVELNNELIRLADQERDEEVRLLRSWADAFRLRLDDVRSAVHGVAEIDSFQARALFSVWAGGCRPRVGPGGALELRDVRHPLLDRRLRLDGERCVPVTVLRTAEEPILVLSGPNAGGKTVALKTLGLAVLMAQAGLPVAAGSASLPLFRQVRADIGDHQSIEADLSTFSAHVRAAGRFVSEASPPALFLFDEIGTGTEPQEGAALARALLERLLEMRVSVVVTTHQSALKAWAFATPGAASAAMDFDLETLRPTYRILHDAAGVSAGLDVASRLGLPTEIIDKARDLLAPDARQTEEMLNQLRASLAAAEAREQDLKLREAELQVERQEVRARADRDAERSGKEAASALDGALEEFRKLARREVGAIRDRRERDRARKAAERAETRLAVSAGRMKSKVDRHTSPTPSTGPPVLEIGARVLVRSLGREGEIVELRGERVQVRLGTTTFTVKRDDLGGGSGIASPEPAPRSSTYVKETGSGAAYELLLLGKTVDEALDEMDRFLDRAALGGLGEVRVVHGHGTGRLRTAIRQHLRGHPLVESHRPGRDGEGGDGATVVRLR